ncbi:hypothetical protein [Pseudoalteromonas luteoviolacea]|uniref:Uncharacterized protein n=1 Tax=Pseudoalteromonas luteoviolacea S4054 TaxID=1129367 RepID=A0A0F6AH85_9GAMM|nr:hypothetical protein [Pseudoalteromonas luteoviolacea]AOT08696.1 hypothetical protein S4054249_12910 [Pseudoalteromonas luteoviolacea]AOT13611.1 hypothetical protein S40542_12885 [Pseudoalteromonas luteoviolacea]AOT18524.1 hypothetical protein S4054_12885 [Pseudoalteromonas luteoviolacea]KKE85585.1 hypothetical protein N479_25560 [Pseudoalteromonas luteoviolacea S4054]KZN72004.1 hypothetical protein N481_16465 [Pseudoalteromonas luteoviolacea S4047-1]
MKLVPLLAGAVLIYFGYEDVTSELQKLKGWALIVLGIVSILSAFHSSKSKDTCSAYEGNGNYSGDRDSSGE